MTIIAEEREREREREKERKKAFSLSNRQAILGRSISLSLKKEKTKHITMNLSKSWSKTTEPSSYDQIYKFIEQSLENYSNFIDQAEIDYYQSTIVSTPRTPTSNRPLSVLTLQVWSPLLNDLREACLLNDIRSSKTIGEILNDVRNGTVYGSINDESVVLIKRILERTTNQLAEKIPKMIDQMMEMMNLMEQYFLSFYDIENIQDIIHEKKKGKIPVSITRKSHNEFGIFP